MNTIVLLGRHGDIVNLLPLAHFFGECNWIVGADFSKVFEGVSYAKAIEYKRGPHSFQEAVAWAKEKSLPNVLPAQVHTNADQRRLNESYAIESWRLAGHRLKYGCRPLVFDQRSPERENNLIDRVLGPLDNRPVVLLANRSMSSPFPKTPELLAKLRGLDANIVDMGKVRAERIYDMVALLDKVACLVTIDTLHLHLARASYCPTVAIINDGWCGSVPPPQAQWVHRYETGRADMDLVVADVQKVLDHQKFVPNICLAVDLEKLNKVPESWPYIPLPHVFARNSKKELNDERELPFFKDVLQTYMHWNPSKNLIVWTNCDVEFTKTGLRQIEEHSKKYDFGCVRRDPEHIGRECFWFRRDWLKRNIENMPDVVLAAPKCDLVIAKWLRKFYKIDSSLESMKYDFAPVDLPPGIVHHEHHPSSWLAYQNSSSAAHNERLWNQ